MTPLGLLSQLDLKPAQRLKLVFKIEQHNVILLRQGMAGIPRQNLKSSVTNLYQHRREILDAAAFVFTGN